jgi:hypothetical protein
MHRAALDRVQGAQQVLSRRRVGRVALPFAQSVADRRQQVGRFLEEHRQQVGVISSL